MLEDPPHRIRLDPTGRIRLPAVEVSSSGPDRVFDRRTGGKFQCPFRFAQPVDHGVQPAGPPLDDVVHGFLDVPADRPLAAGRRIDVELLQALVHRFHQRPQGARVGVIAS